MREASRYQPPTQYFPTSFFSVLRVAVPSAENEDPHGPACVSILALVLRGWDDGFEARASLGVIGLLIAGNCGVSLVFSLANEHRAWGGNGYESAGDGGGWRWGIAGEVAPDDVLEL